MIIDETIIIKTTLGLTYQFPYKLFKVIINPYFKQQSKKMQYNTYFGNLAQLNTLPTLTTTFLHTFTFVYPSNNISSVIDFHYNNNLNFNDLSIYLPTNCPQEQPITPQTSYTPMIVKNKPKKLRLRDEKKELESAKKNSESNLVNQLYSYFSSLQKSQKMVQKVIKSLKFQNHQLQKIKSIFYNTVRHINFKRGRKYVNKENILTYYRPQNCILNMADIIQQLENLNLISIEDFCYIFRVCTFHFIREISITAVLTSKRITSIARNQHLKRRRRLLNSLRQNDSH